MLWDKLHSEHEFRFLLTNRLNQDCVENLFSTIRAKGAQRDNPDAGQFRAAFRQVMVDMVMIPNKGGNCEEDVDKFICTLEDINKSASPSLAPTPEEPSITDTIPWSVKSILSACTLPTKDKESLTYHETNVLAYIAGYIVHKIKGKVCSSCTEKLLGIADTNNPSHDLIEKKSYGGLIIPSQLLLGTVELLELEYRNSIESSLYPDHLKATLASKLSKVDNLQRLQSDACHLGILVMHLYLNIRLHHTIKEINLGLRESKDRRNRKALKFSHV